MNTSSTFPSSPFTSGLNWTSQDLADAVPLRLFELFGFDAGPNGADVSGRCANQRPRRAWRREYLRTAELPAFIRVHS